MFKKKKVFGVLQVNSCLKPCPAVALPLGSALGPASSNSALPFLGCLQTEPPFQYEMGHLL